MTILAPLSVFLAVDGSYIYRDGIISLSFTSTPSVTLTVEDPSSDCPSSSSMGATVDFDIAPARAAFNVPFLSRSYGVAIAGFGQGSIWAVFFPSFCLWWGRAPRWWWRQPLYEEQHLR